MLLYGICLFGKEGVFGEIGVLTMSHNVVRAELSRPCILGMSH